MAIPFLPGGLLVDLNLSPKIRFAVAEIGRGANHLKGRFDWVPLLRSLRNIGDEDATDIFMFTSTTYRGHALLT